MNQPAKTAASYSITCRKTIGHAVTARLDQSFCHVVRPDTLSRTPRLRDDFGLIWGDPEMRSSLFFEHMRLKGKTDADLRSLTTGQQICLLVMFLLSCLLSCLMMWVT